MPIDAPVVYEYSVDDGAMQGGSGKDLANQIYEVLVNALGLQEKDFHFLRGIKWYFLVLHLISELNHYLAISVLKTMLYVTELSL